MKRAITTILLIVASIYSSVITPRWHEGGYTGAFAPYLRDRDNGNPYAGFIMQCGVRSVVYQSYGLYYPPHSPPPPPAPKQKDVYDIVHHLNVSLDGRVNE